MRLAPDVSYFGRKPKGLDVCKRSVCEGGLEQGWGEDWGMRSPVEEEIFFFLAGDGGRGRSGRWRYLRTRGCVGEVLSQSEEKRGRGWVFLTESLPLLNAACGRDEFQGESYPDAILAGPPQLQPRPEGFRKKQSPLDIPSLLQSLRSLSWGRLRSC